MRVYAYKITFPLELLCHHSYIIAVFICRERVTNYFSISFASQLSREFLIESAWGRKVLSHSRALIALSTLFDLCLHRLIKISV